MTTQQAHHYFWPKSEK